MKPGAVDIQGLELFYGEQHILKAVDLHIEQGELVSLVGPSGCGKTSLIKAIAGLIQHQGGSVRIDGVSCEGIPTEARGAVIVFQDLRLFPHMNVYENLAFPMLVKGIDRQRQRARISELISAVKLEGFEKRRVRELSGGQMQRVALARALCAEPKILLLDEPFSGLDENLKLEMENLVLQLHEEMGLTSIMVTHDRAEALRMSDRIAVMNSGRILQYDTPANIYERPADAWVAAYFGAVNVYTEGSRIFERLCHDSDGQRRQHGHYSQRDQHEQHGQYSQCGQYSRSQHSQRSRHGRAAGMFFRPQEVELVSRADAQSEGQLLCRVERIAYEGNVCHLIMEYQGEKIVAALPPSLLEAMGLKKNELVRVNINEIHFI